MITDEEIKVAFDKAVTADRTLTIATTMIALAFRPVESLTREQAADLLLAVIALVTYDARASFAVEALKRIERAPDKATSIIAHGGLFYDGAARESEMQAINILDLVRGKMKATVTETGNG